MKVFWSLVAYMAIGGVFGGITFNAMSDRCGGPVKMSITEFAAGAASWPATLVAAFVVRGKYLERESECVMKGSP